MLGSLETSLIDIVCSQKYLLSAGGEIHRKVGEYAIGARCHRLRSTSDHGGVKRAERAVEGVGGEVITIAKGAECVKYDYDFKVRNTSHQKKLSKESQFLQKKEKRN